MRPIFITALIGLTLSVWGKWEYSSTLRWSPLEDKPIPKLKSSASYDFWSASGRFSINVDLPMSQQEKSSTEGLEMNAQVPCNLGFELYRGNILISASKVNILNQFGATFSEGMDDFDAGTMTVPKFGHHFLKVQNLGGDPKISLGKLSLIRNENTENAAVLSGVFNILIWVFTGTTLIIGIKKAIRHGNNFSAYGM